MNTAYQVSHPTQEATRYTYADGATAYKKKLLKDFTTPQYETDHLGQPLATSLLSTTIIAETIRAVDYHRTGTMTRNGQQFAVYTANGTNAVSTHGDLFHGENITAFHSTLVLDLQTDVIHTLQTQRTTNKLSSGKPVTIEDTYRFSSIGSTSVNQPDWINQLKSNQTG